MNILLTSKDGNFALVETEGVGVNDTPWKGLKVRSSGNAEKHVVEIRLYSDGKDKFNGQPVKYNYTENTYISHGMRGKIDTINETLEYIDVLNEAVEFARRIEDFLNSNEEWRH